MRRGDWAVLELNLGVIQDSEQFPPCPPRCQYRTDKFRCLLEELSNKKVIGNYLCVDRVYFQLLNVSLYLGFRGLGKPGPELAEPLRCHRYRRQVWLGDEHVILSPFLASHENSASCTAVPGPGVLAAVLFLPLPGNLVCSSIHNGAEGVDVLHLNPCEFRAY